MAIKETSFFWTDIEQAQQRIDGSLVIYDDKPVYISGIRSRPDGEPEARAFGSKNKSLGYLPLSDPKFGKFRNLPRLGWLNLGPDDNDIFRVSKITSLYVQRKVKNTRTHGLNSGNVSVFGFDGKNLALTDKRGAFPFEHLMQTSALADCHKGVYPSLEAILENIEENQGIAYSRGYAVYRDNMGLRWLLRKKERVGLFTGSDTLNLFEKSFYLREEIMEDPSFTLNTIREL